MRLRISELSKQIALTIAVTVSDLTLSSVATVLALRAAATSFSFRSSFLNHHHLLL